MFEKCLAVVAWRGRQVAISSSPDTRVRDLKGLASLIPWKLGCVLRNRSCGEADQRRNPAVETTNTATGTKK
jgi:hypothetical protein